MKFFYNNNANVEIIAPRHFLDKDYWSVWNSKANVSVKHGDFDFKWTYAFENVTVQDQ